MRTVYVYVLDTLADWEPGYVTAELHSSRFFKKGAERISLKTVSCSKEPITTMGGLKVVPDCQLDELVIEKTSVLLLPIHGAIRNMVRSSRKQESCLLSVQQSVQSVELRQPLPTQGCWMPESIPATDRGFWRWFVLPTKGRHCTLTRRR